MSVPLINTRHLPMKGKFHSYNCECSTGIYATSMHSHSAKCEQFRAPHDEQRSANHPTFTRPFLISLLRCIAAIIIAVLAVAFGLLEPRCPKGLMAFGIYRGCEIWLLCEPIIIIILVFGGGRICWHDIACGTVRYIKNYLCGASRMASLPKKATRSMDAKILKYSQPVRLQSSGLSWRFSKLDITARGAE